MALSDIRRKLRELTITDKLVEAIGTQAERAVHERTLQGKDMNNRKFKPYAKSTEKSRKKQGRSTGNVTLTDKGFMLSNITSKREGSKAVVFFSKTAENNKAHGHHVGTKHLPPRKFFGIGKKLAGQIMAKTQAHFKKVIG